MADLEKSESLKPRSCDVLASLLNFSVSISPPPMVVREKLQYHNIRTSKARPTRSLEVHLDYCDGVSPCA